LLTVQLTEPPPPPSSIVPVPPAVDDVILRCLNSDSEDRYANVKDLAHALDSVMLRAAPPPPLVHPMVPRAATPIPRAVTPLPTERPMISYDVTDKLARVERRAPVAMIAVAIILFVIGAGLFVAWLM
jgi:hypothetical protein